jgi:ribosome-associated translation inhibitor RaiA/cold shock CspA family protein
MQVPLEISYHNIQKSQAAEDVIRAHVENLEDIYERITSCHVRVDQRADNRNHTIPPVVRIELGIPGRKNLVVAHEPDHLQRKYQTPDLSNAINEAFRIAERQLLDLKEMRETETRMPAEGGEQRFLGQVAEMHPLKDHGFIMNKEGGLLYFHRNSVLLGDFDYLTRGAEVYYVEEAGDTGPTAKKIWVKTASH